METLKYEIIQFKHSAIYPVVHRVDEIDRNMKSEDYKRSIVPGLFLLKFKKQ